MAMRRIREYVDVNENEKKMLMMLNQFHCSFRSLLMPRQAYGANIILVQEQRDVLLQPAYYTQFIIHLANQKQLGNLRDAEFYDIIARLRHGPDYDPRADPKHFVHLALLELEEQRPKQMGSLTERKKKNKQRNGSSRESSISSTTTDGSMPKEPTIATRKRSFDESVGSSSNGATNRPKRAREQTSVETQQPAAKTSEPEEKKRQFKTETPMETLLQIKTLKPTEVPTTCYDDLACRYQFANEKRLKAIWHFMRGWSRELLEWN